MSISSVTTNGLKVELVSNGHAYCGMPVVEFRPHFEHPEFKSCVGVMRGWTYDKSGPQGATGHVFVRCSGEHGTPSARGEYIASFLLLIPRSDYDAIKAIAQADADAAVIAEREEEAREDAATASRCPEGFEPCRRAWSNGDLCSAMYVAIDGTECLDSDLIESQPGGWYWIESDAVEAARAKAKAMVRADKVAAAETAVPEWRSNRGLTLSEEMDREDSDL